MITDANDAARRLAILWLRYANREMVALHAQDRPTAAAHNACQEAIEECARALHIRTEFGAARAVEAVKCQFGIKEPQEPQS